MRFLVGVIEQELAGAERASLERPPRARTPRVPTAEPHPQGSAGVEVEAAAARATAAAAPSAPQNLGGRGRLPPQAPAPAEFHRSQT